MQTTQQHFAILLHFLYHSILRNFTFCIFQKFFTHLKSFLPPWCLQIKQILKLTTTILKWKRNNPTPSNPSKRISKPSHNYPLLEKWKTCIWCFNIRWPYPRAWSEKCVVYLTAEVTFLHFFAKANGIMYFIHPCKELVIPWANVFQSSHNEAASVNTCWTFFIEFLQKWNFGRKSYSQTLMHAFDHYNPHFTYDARLISASLQTERNILQKGVKTLQHLRKSGNSIC